MIKLVIFDLDGVLVDTKDIHFDALNKALEIVDPKYVITREEHLSIYDGLPTRSKLRLLGRNKGLSYTDWHQIEQLKQVFTAEAFKHVEITDEAYDLIQELHYDHEIDVVIASNSVRSTVAAAVGAFDFGGDYISFTMSNEDVRNPKPHPEMYLKCMVKAGVAPDETLIIEDSIHGREAAIRSGAKLCPVNSPLDVTKDFVLPFLKPEKIRHKWKDTKLNVLIPMAGAGSRFATAGYTFPKPLIEVKNMDSKPMIQVVVENLGIEANYIYLVQQDHIDKYNVKQLLNLITPGCTVVPVNGVTEGAACTTLLAREFIDKNQPLLIANSDQFVEWDSRQFLYKMTDNYDGGILTFPAYGVKWSFVETDKDRVVRVAEKNPISNIGTVGIYWWAAGSDYVKYADQMIAKDIRTNGEFYVAPVFNEAIEDNWYIGHHQIETMWGLGDPESLEYFEKNYVHQ